MSPYEEGQSACHEGLTSYDNPYDYHTEEYVEWRQGYYDAEEEYYS